MNINDTQSGKWLTDYANDVKKDCEIMGLKLKNKIRLQTIKVESRFSTTGGELER